MGYNQGVAHSISHGSVCEKYLLSYNRESEKSEKNEKKYMVKFSHGSLWKKVGNPSAITYT